MDLASLLKELSNDPLRRQLAVLLGCSQHVKGVIAHENSKAYSTLNFVNMLAYHSMI